MGMLYKGGDSVTYSDDVVSLNTKSGRYQEVDEHAVPEVTDNSYSGILVIHEVKHPEKPGDPVFVHWTYKWDNMSGRGGGYMPITEAFKWFSDRGRHLLSSKKILLTLPGKMYAMDLDKKVIHFLNDYLEEVSGFVPEEDDVRLIAEQLGCTVA